MSDPQQVSMGRALAAGLTAPIVVAATAIALFGVWAADLPDPLAVHFGSGGEADGFASAAAARWTVLLGPVIAAVLLVALVLPAGRDPRTSRTGACLASGVGSFVAALPILTAIPQRGVADAATVTVPIWWIVVGVAVGALAALLAYLAVPAPGPARATTAPGADAPRIPLGDGERVAWSGSAAMPRWLGVVVFAVPVVLIVTGVGSAVTLLVVLVICAVVVALALMPVRVVVDQRGLTARGVFPLRPITIPLGEVAEAREVNVALLNGFGGYGYRVGPRGVGLIARPGPALEVTRGDGSRFTVTVDGADRAAAVLNSLAARGRV